VFPSQFWLMYRVWAGRCAVWHFWSKVSILGTRRALIFRYPSRSCIMVFTLPTLIPISSEISRKFMRLSSRSSVLTFFVLSSVTLFRGRRGYVSFSTRSRPFLNAEHHLNTRALKRGTPRRTVRVVDEEFSAGSIFSFVKKRMMIRCAIALRTFFSLIVQNKPKTCSSLL